MENEKGIVKLTRKQLYDEIWALSVAGVARKYNLNYGKLIATCKVENISFPSSGYWTKKNMGKDVSNEIVEFSGLEDTEISLITKDAVVKRIRKAKAEVVEKVHTDVKVDIKSGEVDIESTKVDIRNKLLSFSDTISEKTINHTVEIFSKCGKENCFGRTIVEEITGLKPSRASKLIKLLVDSEVIVPVTGHGKGKYRFQ